MIFIQNKYTRIYYTIISCAQARVLADDTYTESHHIVPKSLGGSNSKDNLVALTAREHFICHRLLVKMTTGKAKRSMAHAVWAMINYRNQREDIKVTSRTYQYLRITKAEAQSAYMLTHNPMNNKDSRQKCSQPGKLNGMFGKVGPNKGKTGKLFHLYGRTRLEHSRIMKANPPGLTACLSSWTCPHCNKTGGSLMNYHRWHGDNCKSLKGFK